MPSLPALVRLQACVSDEDRGVWTELALKTAPHPSETGLFLATRLLAHCLRWEEGLGFSPGLCEPDEPALIAHELDGRLRTWIEVGLPDPERLHRAAKRAERVVVFPHRPAATWRERCRAKRIHRAGEIEVVEIEVGFLEWVEATIAPRARWDVWISAGELRVSIEGRERATMPAVRPLSD
jgi:uncharacterized protein YaeQ